MTLTIKTSGQKTRLCPFRGHGPTTYSAVLYGRLVVSQRGSQWIFISVLYVFCVSEGGCEYSRVWRCVWGKGGGVTDTDSFERMQRIEGRERARVTVLWGSTDFIVQSVVSSCSTGVWNQNQRPENEYVFFKNRTGESFTQLLTV